MESTFFARLDRIGREHAPTDLVENRVTFGAEHAAFSVYDTVRPAERVPLAADNPLYCGMVTGKKVVHTAAGLAIPFLPLESLVVPTGQTIEMGSIPETRPADIPYFVTDNAKVGETFGWSPQKDARDIACDIHAWLADNHDLVRAVFT